MEIDIRVKEYAEKLPASYKNAFLTARDGTGINRAAAVKAMCQQCMGYQDVAKRVRACSVWKCPLWDVRPYQTENEGE